MSQSTLQPRICGRCESAIPPFRSKLDGSQCGCPEPSSPAPVPNDSLCFYTRDVAATEPVSLAPALDRVEAMRLASGTTPSELIAERVEEARTELLAARKLADRFGEGELHRKACELYSDVDDFMAMLADRSAR